MAYHVRARSLARFVSSPINRAHPMARPASIPWVAVVILVLTVGVGHWAAMEVLMVLALLMGMIEAVSGTGG